MPADTFTMALNNYRQTGGGGFSMLRDAPVVYDRQLEIRQLLIDEVRAERHDLAGRLFSSQLADRADVPRSAIFSNPPQMTDRMVRVFVNAAGVDVPVRIDRARRGSRVGRECGERGRRRIAA